MADESPKFISKAEAKQMTDDEFFEAYRQGRVQRRTDALTEDNWEKEIESMPLFANDASKIDPDSPAVAALQKIIQDDLDPIERAKYHKEHANKEFLKAKAQPVIKVRDTGLHKALEMYAQALAEKCEDNELNAAIYANRAAINVILNNHRRVIDDCEISRKLNPNNIKVYWRAITSASALDKIDEVIQWCDYGLAIEPSNPMIIDQRLKAVKIKAERDRDLRIKQHQIRKKKEERKNIMNAIKSRGIKLGEALRLKRESDDSDDEQVIHMFDVTQIPTPTGTKVHLDKENKLHWPVGFFYPESQQTDFIQDFNEEHTLFDHLSAMFPEEGPSVPWDQQNQYRVSNLQVYFECQADDDKKKLIKVDINCRLKTVLSDSRYIIHKGTPSFLVLVKSSPFDKQFQEKYAK